MKPWDMARQVKHRIFLARRAIRSAAISSRDVAYRAYDRAVPLRFDVDRHRTAWGELPRMYFLHREPPAGTTGTRSVPRRIFTLWTGQNPMSEARLRGLKRLREVSECEVTLVTRRNLAEFIVPGHPLHPAYDNLSLTHRSDYLRAYLMHHHGGGYADVKPIHHPWGEAFASIQEDPGAWMIGYRELGSDRVGGRDARLGPEIRRRYRSIAGFGAFICRPGTPLTGEWLREIERRMSYYEDELAEFPGNVLGDNPGYPILWIEIGMDVLYPLELKYHSHIRFDDRLLPQLEGHR